MPTRKNTATKPAPRTPIAEWTAAGLGLASTLAVLGYAVWEGLTDRSGPPVLTAASAPAERAGPGYVVPVTIRNESPSTAASVEVTATLELSSGGREERRATFTYVPGQGEAKGGVMFLNDPARGRLTFAVEGYEDP
jgi:uncharacterized protein (TIGR02588 family)